MPVDYSKFDKIEESEDEADHGQGTGDIPKLELTADVKTAFQNLVANMPAQWKEDQKKKCPKESLIEKLRKGEAMDKEEVCAAYLHGISEADVGSSSAGG